MDGRLQNIIIVYDYAHINGGAAKVAIQSAICLSRLGYNVVFFSAMGPIDENLNNSMVETICLNQKDINTANRINAIFQGIYNRYAGEKFNEVLNRFSPSDTIVHFHGWTKALSSAVVKIACDQGFKVIITLHDYFTLCPNGGFYNYQKQKICTHKPMSPACMFCNCDKRSYGQKVWRVARQMVQDRNVRNNLNVTYISIAQKNEDIVRPYVKSKDFFRVDNPVQLAEHKIGDCSKSNKFLYIGRLSEEKGIDLFCRAITDLKAEFDIQGVVVGAGALYNSLRREYPAIQFEGWKSPGEVREYIQSARALVLPSQWYEGAPLTIIEAMSAGLPCIVSDCTSATEIIENGVNGYLFEAGSVEGLKKKLRESMNEDICSVQKIISHTDFSAYTDDAYVNRILSVYKDTIHRVGGRM